MVKIAQPLFVACVIAMLAACAPVQTAQAPPPPPPPPPPQVVAPAPAPEVPYYAPRWHYAKHWRHHRWCHCGPVRHHWRHHRWHGGYGMAPAGGPAPMAPAPGAGPAPMAPGGAPAPMAPPGGPRPSGH